MKQETHKGKIQIISSAVFVGVLLSLITVLFINTVREQLWKESVNTIMESTQQGCDTLRVQLQEEYKAMEKIAGYLQNLSSGQTDELESILHNYSQVDQGISFYLEGKCSFPTDVPADETAISQLPSVNQFQGIIEPHISSATGVNVFHLFIKVSMQDGSVGYLLKEYEVDSIVDSFSLSFYQDSGFSYVINTNGSILIRPPHPNSNKTVRNLFDILQESKNNPDDLERFRQSLAENKTGWATFSYQGEDTVFCYIPLKLETGWYLISIIPKGIVNAQTNQIILRTLFLIAAIIFGIILLVLFYSHYASQANRKLKNQADYIGHLYNAVPEGIALLTLEQPYRFIQMNQEGLRLLDYPEDDAASTLSGMTLQDVIHEDDYEHTAALFQDAALRGKKNIFENRVRKTEGGFFWASGVVEKTLDENGKDILIATFHDITDEKRAEEEAEREKLLERMMLLQAVSDIYPIIVSLNLTKDTLKFVYIREGILAEFGNQTSYSALFEEYVKTVHPDNLEEFIHRFTLEHLRNVLGTERNEVFLEGRQLLTDGQYHWISAQIIYVENPYVEDKLAILICRRIDEQRHMEEQQRQALESALENAKTASMAKSRFLSNMSHDIRTPMNAIIGMTAIASAHLNDRSRVMECLKNIGLSSQHLLSLINDVLDMSKIESGKLSLREEPLNFAELVSDVTELIRPRAEQEQLEMQVRMAVEYENVIGDPLRLRQVFLNILSNAVKYTPAGGKIYVEIEQGNGHKNYQNYIFRCTDTGFGMAPEFLKKLFQPFERAQDSTSSKITGTGLGMTITKNIVDLMNGTIQVESTPDKGSTFTITIPLQQENAQQEELPAEWLGVHSLIVDDDQQTCENCVSLLESIGLRAEFVTEGKEAICQVLHAKNGSDPFELIIIDWKMPVMDGIEVTRRIRREVGMDVPVIILTAYDWPEIEHEAKEAGVTTFLSKPLYRSKICYTLYELGNEKQPVPNYTFSGTASYNDRRILLVEDNEMNREIAHVLIEELGVEVEEACDGAEAVQKVSCSSEGYYDLIFMDVQMPVMDGYEATKAIRAMDRKDTAAMPIIAMTANAFDEDVQDALQAGMNAHFAKPIDIEKLELLLQENFAKAAT